LLNAFKNDSKLLRGDSKNLLIVSSYYMKISDRAHCFALFTFVSRLFNYFRINSQIWLMEAIGSYEMMG